MSRRGRRLLLVPALALLAALLVWALVGLPAYGHRDAASARRSAQISVQQRQTGNAVNAVTFDLRGLDTLGEDFILFVAAIGGGVLLRAQRREEQTARAAERADRRRPETSAALRALGAALVGPVLVLGLYVVAHGHLSPGGGFQGGVILAGALLLVYAAGQVVALKRASPEALVEVAEAVGAAAFALVAVGGLVFGVAALANFLPPGTRYELLSSGTIGLLNGAVGVEVTGGIALLLTEFLDQTLLRGASDR